jgi:predicted GIY-YIG superfamily endonuclease
MPSRVQAVKNVPRWTWGSHTTLWEWVKIHPLLYHTGQMFPWAWTHWRGVGWFTVFVVWWTQLGFTLGLLMTGITWGVLTTWLVWKRAPDGVGRSSFSEYREEKAHRKLLARKWSPACDRFGLTEPGRGGDAPKLRKVKAMAGGSIEAQVVTADAMIPEAEFLKRSSDFASVFQCHDVIMTRTGPGEVRVVFHWRDAVGRILPLADLPVPPKGKVAYGIQANGQAAAFQMRQSVLIGGLTEHGKSNAVHAAIASLLRDQIPIWLYISDPKGGMELGAYGRRIGEKNGNLTVKGYATTPAESEKMFALVHKNMQTRQRVFAEGGKRGWEPGPDNPLVVVICDELLELPETLKKGSTSDLASIVRLGRAVGYTAWVCTQVGQLDAVGRLRNFIPQRMSFATRDSQTTNAFLGDGASAAGADCHNIRQPGIGYALNSQDRAAQKFRAAFVDDKDLELIAAGTLPPELIAHTREQIGEVIGEHALYRHFDIEKNLLYVGETNNYARRSDEHKDKPWWKDVASTTVEWFPSRKAAKAAEKAAILSEHPRENYIHNTDNPNRARRVLQRKTDQRGPSTLAERRAVREKESAGDAA